VQLVFLGIVGEYLSRMFTEIKARPHYLVKEYIESSLEETGTACLTTRLVNRTRV
jgi:hypothetical protein